MAILFIIVSSKCQRYLYLHLSRTFDFIAPVPVSFLRTCYVGETDRRVGITGYKSWCNGIKFNVSVLVNLVERRHALIANWRLLFAQGIHVSARTHTHTYAIIWGDKDVTLHSIMALLVGVIMFHVPHGHEFIPLESTRGSYKDRNIEGNMLASLSRISQ